MERYLMVSKPIKNFCNHGLSAVRSVWSNVLQYTGFRMLKRFCQRLWSGCLWFVEGFNDYQYDYSFIYKTLRFKLVRMREFYAGETSSTCWQTTDSSKTIVEEIDVAISYIDRIEEHPYHEEFEKQFIKKYGALPINHDNMFGPDKEEWTEEDTKAGSKEWKHWNEYTNIAEELREAAEKEFEGHYRMIDIKEQEDINALFRHIGTHLRGWWD